MERLDLKVRFITKNMVNDSNVVCVSVEIKTLICNCHVRDFFNIIIII